MNEKILKELKELVKISSKTGNFIFAEAQLLKTISLEVQSMKREIKKIHEKMEERWPQLEE